MLIFGHPGLTLAAAVLANGLYDRLRPGINGSGSPAETIGARATNSLTSLSRRVDLRLLMAASFLPDIIDKPLGMVFLANTFHNGRIYAHTLLFMFVVCVLAGLAWRQWRFRWPAVLAFGTVLHLVFDYMWRMPQTLFWPLYGTDFSQLDLSNWLPETVNELTTNPAVYVPEILGLLILIWLGGLLWKRRALWPFIRHGTLSAPAKTPLR